MRFTLRRVCCGVYSFSFLVIALLSACGALGTGGIQSIVDWVLVAWLSGYASIVILLAGGTFHWGFKEVFKGILNAKVGGVRNAKVP